MLGTLSKIGEQLLEGKGIWARLTVEPKYDPAKKNWVIPILFDCDAEKIELLESEKEIFDPEKSAIDFRYISTGLWGPRGKKCCVTCEQKNFKMLKESLLGNPGKQGSMSQAIDSFYDNPNSTPFRNALREIAKLKNRSSDLDISKFKNQLNFGKSEEVVLYYAMIKSCNINEGKPIALFKLDGYEDFIFRKFASSKGKAGLNYLTGLPSEQVVEAKFLGRYNINKLFQTTTFNYASELRADNFNKNFQVSPDSVTFLDKASDYTLNRLQARIAGLPHIVVPNYLQKDLEDFRVEDIEIFINHSNDLLFKSNELEKGFKRKLPDLGLFWINYIAFESDGNSFKIINHIKDVNSKHLSKVVDTFKETGWLFRDLIGEKYLFNLQSLYWIIPVREGDKEKKNEVLVLYKEILEQRKVSQNKIYDFFVKMILCHRFERYKQYQFKRSAVNFDFAVHDTVFRYSALMYALKQLKLLDMDTTKEQAPYTQSSNGSNAGSEFQKKIDDLFNRLEYTPQEKAMFYLGRVLNAVASAQYRKGHKSKPVLNKINFNGMDAAAILRLDLDLAEKSRQYNIHGFTEPNFSRFREQFKEDKWTLTSQQNVFFLMAGYTFGISGLADQNSNSDNQ